jgi:perosamine synthetase
VGLGDTAPSCADLLYPPVPNNPRVSLRPGRMDSKRLVESALASLRPSRTKKRLLALIVDEEPFGCGELCSSGRTALRYALECVGARPGRRVVLSTFNCPAVVDAVLATGAEPALVDFSAERGPDFLAVNLDNAVVILTNGLGRDEWAEQGERLVEAGATVLLDLAQAIPAPRVVAKGLDSGNPVVLSFGEGKPLGGIGGGVALFPPGFTPVARPELASSERGGARELRRVFLRHCLERAPAPMRRAAARGEQRKPGWSRTKADHLPDEAEKVGLVSQNRWQSAAALALARDVAFVAEQAERTHATIRRTVASVLTNCEVVLGDSDLSSGIELLFAHSGDRFVFAGELARRGVPSSWNHYPLHKMRPYRHLAHSEMAEVERLWPRVLTVPKQPQARLDERWLAGALLAADNAVTKAREGASR